MVSWSSDLLFYMTDFPKIIDNAEAISHLSHKPTNCLEKNQVFIEKISKKYS